MFLAHITIRLEKLTKQTEDTEWFTANFMKLLLNFAWWVNLKNRSGKNVFEGGFLGSITSEYSTAVLRFQLVDFLNRQMVQHEWLPSARIHSKLHLKVKCI